MLTITFDINETQQMFENKSWIYLMRIIKKIQFSEEGHLLARFRCFQTLLFSLNKSMIYSQTSVVFHLYQKLLLALSAFCQTLLFT